MDGQQQAQRTGFAPGKQCQATGADQEQKRDEATIHRFLILVPLLRVTPQIHPEQTCRADQQTYATEDAEQHWQA
ncbi:hypothetical protein D3C76_900740 [compost metagenome]